MRIGIVLGRIGGVDGVALETEKWITVLRRLGHEVAVLTGELEAERSDTTILPELAFSHPLTIQEQADAFFVQQADEGELMDRLELVAEHIARGVGEWLASERIEVLITENATTLPCHLAMGMGLRRVIERTGITTISHDHDFHWERGDRYASRYAGVNEIIDDCFPLDLPNVAHVVINTFNQEGLRRERGISALVAPNVMDFDESFGRLDDFNGQLPTALGLDSGAIHLFQVTRIVRRKGIETAIELVERLDDPRIKLVVTGTATDDHNGEYLDELRQRASLLPRPEQVLFAGERFGNARVSANGRPPVFSLSDGYAHAHACTYFSRYEGFGNAFVEAVAARVPIFVNNYQPVYWPDIGSKGFKTVQIEDNQLTDDAVDQVRKVLTDDDHRAEIADHNFDVGRQHFSFDVLAGRLEPLVAT